MTSSALGRDGMIAWCLVWWWVLYKIVLGEWSWLTLVLWSLLFMLAILLSPVIAKIFKGKSSSPTTAHTMNTTREV